MNNKKLLIDSSNPEEMRIAVINNNNNLEDYDFEVTNKEEVKGNIYLAKITRVEASLQAAFVEYGRNRQGFLPFNEISIQYFNLPEEIKEDLKNKEIELRLKNKKNNLNDTDSLNNDTNKIKTINESSQEKIDDNLVNNKQDSIENSKLEVENPEDHFNNILNNNDYFMDLTKNALNNNGNQKNTTTDSSKNNKEHYLSAKNMENYAKEDSIYGSRLGYKIQDVIQKNQFLLVQVVKDERGNKGASLTTYISIAGRYCVLMPNSYNVDGGISKKINNSTERQRLKSILSDIEIPKDNSIIIRTAGVDKTSEEIKQDYTYIINLWENIKSKAEITKTPALIYEEGNLIKKIIRDSLSNEISEIYIEDKDTYFEIIDFAKLIAPDIVKKIKLYKNKNVSIFQHFNIEEQVRSIYSPVVFLKSGGYIVINPTEALTAIDINSGKFKGNRNVEETALKNNLEACSEIAKQLKLRNIGGLVVIDFIDMENSRNRAIIEKKFKDEIKSDKAKIQVGQISNFGLLEIARQHVKSSLFEKSFTVCSKCQGIGYVRPLELNSLQILRNFTLDIMKSKFSSKQIKIKIPTNEAFYILNNKRDALNKIEDSLNISLSVECNDNIAYPFYVIEEVNELKNEETTVLLLETEIANNMNINQNNRVNKPHNKNIKYNKKNKYNKNKNIGKNISNIETNIQTKKSWIRKLLKI